MGSQTGPGSLAPLTHHQLGMQSFPRNSASAPHITGHPSFLKYSWALDTCAPNYKKIILCSSSSSTEGPTTLCKDGKTHSKAQRILFSKFLFHSHTLFYQILNRRIKQLVCTKFLWKSVDLSDNVPLYRVPKARYFSYQSRKKKSIPPERQRWHQQEGFLRDAETETSPPNF